MSVSQTSLNTPGLHGPMYECSRAFNEILVALDRSVLDFQAAMVTMRMLTHREDQQVPVSEAIFMGCTMVDLLDIKHIGQAIRH